ncbi:Membrane protein involved in the export of O-antigen and teichoic acid [Psychrobacillus psychrotolerans]|uniref:Membrane protein involved in the export of O-antigen and teichoic acid n=1 Tax=Psychrobacillus psychrotolerans TaxID=126156 RepID=A0A1I6A1U7_9BACI|nr:flippase [Psychrobacillus psychrotolerans]SFQ62618.1 Membrane protein involved in the export of O-antigen and teichoic acid [Psychrobacillus psychrotolerans]
MKKNRSLKKNFLYNFSLNIINVLFPIITMPYVLRVLGADSMGKYNFSVSFSQWFLIFATFGTVTYGIREIAKVRDNEKDLDKTFTEIFLINFIATTISIFVYITIIFISPKTNMEIELFLIAGILIFLNLFCIDWFYMGIEEFKMITLRSILIKLICLLGIFIFINEKNDYNVYALITVLAFGFANIINLIYSFKFVKFTFKEINLKKHMKFIFVFFYSSVIVSVYTLFDQVFLGFYATNTDVAFYSLTKQIYYIALSITLSISVVLLPKLTNLANYDILAYKKMLIKSIDYIYLFSIPAVIGLIILSKDIVWVIGGEEFEGAFISLIIVAILVFTVSLGTWQYDQLFLPLGHEKIGLKNQLFMALMSLLLNILLVPKYGYIGASISLVITEISGTIFGIYYAKRKITEVKFKYITKSFSKYIVASIIMGLVIQWFKFLGFASLYNIAFGIIFGSCIYLSLLFFLKESICREFYHYFQNKVNFL